MNCQPILKSYRYFKLGQNDHIVIISKNENVEVRKLVAKWICEKFIFVTNNDESTPMIFVRPTHKKALRRAIHKCFSFDLENVHLPYPFHSFSLKVYVLCTKTITCVRYNKQNLL